MEDKNQNAKVVFPNSADNVQSSSGGFDSSQQFNSQALTSEPVPLGKPPPPPSQGNNSKEPNPLVRFVRRADVVLAILLILGSLGWIFIADRGPKQQDDSIVDEFATTEIPLAEFFSEQGITFGAQTVTVNGSLVLAPTTQPAAAVAGQIYFDQTSNVLAYYNGAEFVPVGGEGVTSIQGQAGGITFNGAGGITITSDGAGNITFTGPGAAAPTGPSVSSLNGLTGPLTIANASAAGTTITINDASTTDKGIASFNADNFTVNGGVVNTVQNIGPGATPSFAAVNTNTIQAAGGLNLVGGDNVTIGAVDPTATLLVVDTKNTAGDPAGVDGAIYYNSASGNFRCYQGGIWTNCITASGGFVSLQNAYDNSSPAIITLNSTNDGILIRDANPTIGGNLFAVQNNDGSVTYLSVATTGVTTSNLLTGGLTATGAATMQSTLDVQGSSINIGGVAQQGSLLLNAGNGNVGTLQVVNTLGQNTVYTLPDPNQPAATICLSTGNCAGAGTGVTTSGGTNNRLAKFTGAQNIEDSTITDDGTTVTTSANMVIQGGGLTLGTSSQSAALVLHDGNGQSTTLQAGDSSSDLTFVLPTNTGTDFQCLKKGAGNQLIWDDCTGGTGGGGVTSLNTFTGNLTIQGTANQIVVGSSGTDTITLATPQDIATTSSPTFADLTLTGDIAVNGGDITSTSALTVASTGGNININANGTIELQDSTNVTGALSTTSTITLGALGATNTATYLCYNGSNQLAACSTNSIGSAFVQGGNSFGGVATLGTNDNNDLVLERNNAPRMTVGANNITLANDIDLILQGSTAYISNTQGATNSEAFGLNATVGNVRSTAVGRDAETVGSDSTVVGYAATTGSSAGTAIGSEADAGFQGTAIGRSSVAGQGGIAIGVSASNNGRSTSIAIGRDATNTADNQMVIGAGGSAINSVRIGNGVTNAAPTGFTLQGTSGSGTNIAGASVTIAGGQGTGTGNGGSLLFQIANPGSSGSSLNPLSTVFSLSGTNGSAIFRNTTNSTSALQVQNSAGSTVLDVDTTNGRVGIGTAAPERQLDLVVNNSTVDALPFRILQQGSGDTGMELRDASGLSFFMGMDASAGSAFKIASSTSSTTGGSAIDGWQFAEPFSSLDNAANTTFTTMVTASMTGNVTSISVLVGDVDGANPGGAVAIYADNAGEPGALIASSAGQTLTADTYNTFPISASVTASTNYWLAYMFQGAGTEQLYDFFGGSGVRDFTVSTYPTFAGTLVGQTPSWTDNSSRYPIYMVTEAAAPGTGTFGGISLLDVTDSGALTVQNSTNSTAAFRVLNAAAVPIFTVDTVNSRVYIGNPSADSTGALLVLDTKNTAGDPNGVNGAMYFNSVSGTFRCYQDNMWSECSGVPRPNTRRTTYYVADGDCGWNGYGDVFTVFGSTGGSCSAPPAQNEFETGGTSGNSTGLAGEEIYGIGLYADAVFQSSLYIVDDDSIRVWAGFTDQTQPIMAASAMPAGEYLAFRYDTGAGDSTFKCVTNNGTSSTVVDSGVEPGGDQNLEISFSRSRAIFKIGNRVVCNITTTLPESNISRALVSATTLTNQARSIYLAWIYVENRSD